MRSTVGLEWIPSGLKRGLWLDFYTTDQQGFGFRVQMGQLLMGTNHTSLYLVILATFVDFI